MIKGLFVDNMFYDVACGVKREAREESSPISGYLMSGAYYNDIKGYAFDYTITIAIPSGYENQYFALYEKITDGLAEHSFILPYNNTMKEIKGHVQKIQDTYVRADNGGGLWRAISFTITSSHIDKEA